MKLRIKLTNGREFETEKYASISKFEEVLKVMGHVIIDGETIQTHDIREYYVYDEVKDNDKKEQVKQPGHYADRVDKGLPETIDAIASTLENENLTARMGYLMGNTNKYASRLGLKDDFVQDVKKMTVYFLWFLDEVDNDYGTTILEDILKDRKIIGGGYDK